MLTSDQFKRVIFQSLEASIIQAGTSPRAPELSPQETERAVYELAAAAQRLKDDPSLLSGDPGGTFTFEDPVLAVAALWARRAEDLFDSMVVSAGSQGEDLKSGLRWSWAVAGVHAFLSRGDHNKIILGGRTPAAPLTSTKQKLRIAIVGDAGYRGVAQDNVIALILNRHHEAPFDYVIHLGDVYFAGGMEEMARNFLHPFSKIRNAGARLFTLVGNHDLYYGGEGYLFALSLLDQPGRYFLITNPYWRIACLDTSLGAAKILGNDAKLDDGQLTWFEDLLHDDDPRKLVLMSHHFLVSGWEKPAQSLTDQLRKKVSPKTFAWYWGHEHCCSLYPREQNGYFGACVGNGSFLEKKRKPNSAFPQPAWFPSSTCQCYQNHKIEYWPHGYLELELEQYKATETVWLEDNSSYQRVLDAKPAK